MYKLSALRLWSPNQSEKHTKAILAFKRPLFEIEHQIFNFHSALELIAFSRQMDADIKAVRKRETNIDTREQLNERRRTVHEWAMIAYRDAVMTAYHFSIALEGINLREVPEYLNHVDVKLLRSVRNRFQTEFPGITRTRDSLAHSGERASRPEEAFFSGGIEKPALNVPPGGSIALSGTVIGDEVTSTVVHPHTKEVLLVSVAVNAETLNKLVAVRDELYEFLLPLEKALQTELETFFSPPNAQSPDHNHKIEVPIKLDVVSCTTGWC